MEISEAANGPGRMELIIKEQQQRFKEVEEKKEALKADSGNFKNNNDKYLETPKNAVQDFHPAKSENLWQEKDSQSSAGRRNRKHSNEHLYSGIPGSNIGGDDSYKDKYNISHDSHRIGKKSNPREFENAPEQPSGSSTISIKENHFGNSQPRLHRHTSLKGERDSHVNEQYREKGFESIIDNAERILSESNRQPYSGDFRSPPPRYNDVIGKT